MNWETLCNILMAAATVGGGAAAAAVFGATRPENLAARERLCRNRRLGLLLTFPATLYCVPLAVPVTPELLLPWLWPLAVILPVLCFFRIDAYAARGLALWLIVAAYAQIHAAFDAAVPGTAAVAAVNFTASIAGIWISARPCALRDLFRAAAVRRAVRYAAAGGFALVAATALYLTIQLALTGGGRP